jgi:hypothetical protein
MYVQKNIWEEILRSCKAKYTSKLKAQEQFFSKQKSGYSNVFKNLSLGYKVDLDLMRIYTNGDIFGEAQILTKKKKGAQKGGTQELLSYL